MVATKTLEQACQPRATVFQQRAIDTVYSVDDLEDINPAEFFSENYITDGMRLLLGEAFKRLEGKSFNAPGTFLLSQSMGGGKTHNLIALGLLAKFPQWREQVMSSFYIPGPLGAVRVIKFSGRKTNTPFGIWGELAEQLNRKQDFQDFYSPLKPPGDEDWVRTLRGDPLLILLDELPSYFEAAGAVQVGARQLDTITTTALSNLLVAVNSGKLPNVCVVITDLAGTAYQVGSEALKNLQKEVDRGVTRIDPVRINTNEIYHILRTRLFEALPSGEEISAVAESFRKELDRAKLMDITAASPEQLKTEIGDTYPFHPAIRDLYARVKENPGFQQTRALIRIMRLVIANLWESGRASQKYLVGAHDFDLQDQHMLSEIRQINPHLEPAIAHDIVAEGGEAVAQQIDRDGPGGADGVCKLLFLSSLSQAQHPIHGLEPSEIARYLAAPGQDLRELSNVIDRLRGEAWYLHPTRDGKLVFKDTVNLNAKLYSYTQGMMGEQREHEVRARMEQMFKPQLRTCYQQVQALPALDHVKLDQNETTLVVFRPSATALGEIQQFWQYQAYKNRVIFLTGTATGYEKVLQRAAELKAIGIISGELQDEGRRQDDPQMEEAADIHTKKAGAFYQACRETFQTLYYPAKNNLISLDFEPKYLANEYKGEEQIINALREVYKYREDTSPEGPFPNMVEDKLWHPNSKEMKWSEIKRRAATDPSWVWHHSRALEDLKTELVRRDIWREHGEYVERGPFPKPPSTVTVQELNRDESTGEVTLHIRALHGETVLMSEEGRATTASPKLESFEFRTRAIRLSFLCLDSRGDHEAGEPVEWCNKISVKHRFFQDADQRRCELQAIPRGSICYTTDGSAPSEYGVEYTEPFVVPQDCWFVLAVAEADGVRSDIVQFEVPRKGGGVTVDSKKPATWKRRHTCDDTNSTYTWLETAVRCKGSLGGVGLTVFRDRQWVELRLAEEVFLLSQTVIQYANQLKEIVPDGNVSLEVESTRFECGQDLLNMVSDLKTELCSGEVAQ